MLNSVKRFLADDRGLETVEYAIIAGLIVTGLVAIIVAIGVWVKGNSGWGEIMWEMQDAKGATYLSQGIYMDWPGNISINFDGWNFLRLPGQHG